MPPPDLTKLFLEERARRRAAAAGVGTSTSSKSEESVLESLETRPALTLADFDVGKNAPCPTSGLFYLPDFVTEGEEQQLLKAVRCHKNQGRWTTGNGGRRVANWGGRPSHVTVTEALPTWATAIRDALFSRNVFSADDKNKGKHVKPNHVLVNEYASPHGIPAHNDGDVYAPCVAILTLQGDALIDFWENDDGDVCAIGEDERENDEEDLRIENDLPKPTPRAQVMLRRRSLLVYKNEAYELRHGIRRAYTDVIGNECVNLASANVEIDDRVQRGNTRVSIVFVIKRKPEE